MKEPIRNSGALPFALLAFAVLVLAIAGYGGYVLYPRFNLPSVTGMGLFVLAVAAGIASFFSPCSFPLLVTLLSRVPSEEETGGQLRRALGFATALSFGAVLFLLMTGAVIASGGGAIFKNVTFTSATGRTIRAVVGLLLITLGAIQAGILPVSFHAIVNKVSKKLLHIDAALRRKTPVLGFVLFGFIYILAGFG